MTQEEKIILIEKLEIKRRKFNLSRKERLFKYPFLTIRDSLAARILNQIFRGRLTIKAAAKLFFGEKMYLTIPPYYDILFYGAFVATDPEVRLTKFFINNLNENDVFFDLGANYGYYSLLASKLVGSQGKVFSFEPDPENFIFLKKNKRENISILNKAVTDLNGVVDFYTKRLAKDKMNSAIDIENSRISSKDELYRKITVESITLDDFCSKNKIYPDFIKIDVEGAEEKVLKGAQEILKNQSPIIAMEVIFDPFTEIYKNAIKILTDNNFKIFAIDRETGKLNNLKLEQISQYSNDLQKYLRKMGDGSFDNLIFLKPHSPLHL
ncbi:MAG: FkbM family methyltransferase [Patescibacteria group bacterium]